METAPAEDFPWAEGSGLVAAVVGPALLVAMGLVAVGGAMAGLQGPVVARDLAVEVAAKDLAVEAGAGGGGGACGGWVEVGAADSVALLAG